VNRTALAALWPPTAAAANAAGHRPISPMQAIRRKCIDCSGGQVSEVRSCEAVGCALWPFRAGRHPFTKKALQEADSATSVVDGIPGAPEAAPPGNSFQQASFAESGAFRAPGTIAEEP
jgi:hypothetical protein